MVSQTDRNRDRNRIATAIAKRSQTHRKPVANASQNDRKPIAVTAPEADTEAELNYLWRLLIISWSKSRARWATA